MLGGSLPASALPWPLISRLERSTDYATLPVVAYDELIFRVHALQRMFERGISETDVREVLEHGETIEAYPDDVPYPSRLILGSCGGRPVHVLASDDPDAQATVIVIVYEPDRIRWDASFRRRR